MKPESINFCLFSARYFIGGPGKHMVEKTAPGLAVQRFCDLAVKYNLDVVPGTLIERDPKDGRVYNTAYYIDRSGEILLSYRKVHLWHPERKYLTKGESGYGTCKNRFGIEVGLCVCWDIAFPEVFRELALKQNAQLIIAPGMCVTYNIKSNAHRITYVFSILEFG